MQRVEEQNNCLEGKEECRERRNITTIEKERKNN
jgi:hypothetical protein